MRKRTLVAVWALGAPLTVWAGCGSNSSAKVTGTTATTVSIPASSTTGSGTSTPPPPPTTRGAAATTATPRPTAPGGTIHLADQDNGMTITVARGRLITVALSSTYWTFSAPTSGAVLQQVGAVKIEPAAPKACVPGQGCGTVSVTYNAVGSGQARISASRTTCGEALKCSGGQGTYSVQVTVTAR